MINRVWDQIEKYRMIEKGDHVIAGISGGADSVCLLFMLLELKSRIPFSLTAVHVEHGVRGSDSLEDARFVQRLCERELVPFVCRRVDVPALAKERRVSVEEAGRMARYEVFEETADELGGTKIAVAHNQNDNAETILLNLFRGTGIRGMCGIPPVRGKIIRPLLCLERREIEKYLAETGREYRHDSSNDCGDYTRNRIRLHILPLAEQEINSETVSHLAESAGLLRETEEFITGEAKKLKERCVGPDSGSGELTVLLREFNAANKVLKRYVIRMCLEELAGSLKDLTRTHVEAVLSLAEGETGRQAVLPDGITAYKNYGSLCMRRAAGDDKKEKFSDTVCETVLIEPETGRIKEIALSGYRFQAAVLEWKENENITEKTYTKWFDYDIIKNTVQIRTRRPGDYLTVDKQGGRQKLKTYFINEKIPREERERLLVLADGSHVLWVIGHRISELAKVTGQTKRVLRVQAEKIVPYGGNHVGEN